MIKQNLLEKYNMKKESNIKIIIFICLFVLIFSFLIFSQADVANAQIKFKPQINIGKFIKSGDGYTIPGSTKGIAEYIHAIYNYAIAVVGIFAVVIMMFGGIAWIAAAGNAERIGEAKAWIGASLTGLLLTLCSWMILKTVNPALVEFNPTVVNPVIERIGGRCRIAAIPNELCIDGKLEKECINLKGTWEKDKICPTPCCAWTQNNTATALCQVTPGCSGALYDNCDNSQKTLTQESCNAKPGYTSYLSDGKCVKRTLIGTSNTLTSYQCVSN